MNMVNIIRSHSLRSVLSNSSCLQDIQKFTATAFSTQKGLLPPENFDFDNNSACIDIPESEIPKFAELQHPDPRLSNLSRNRARVALSMIDTKLYQPAISTLAEIVQHSTDLQRLVAIGVSLRDAENHEGAPDLLARIKYYPDVHNLVTLFSELGIEDIGSVITKCPFLLAENVNLIKERLMYLSSKKFTREQIAHIASTCPKLLLEEISEIDARLGAIQKMFQLTAGVVRSVATQSPRLVLWDMLKLKKFHFTLERVYNFDKEQLRRIIKGCPSVALTNSISLEQRMDYILETMMLTVDDIAAWPSILRTRVRKLKERHSILEHLGLAEYDSTKPGYVSLKQLVSQNDENFCTSVAKIPKEQFYEFIKTL